MIDFETTFMRKFIAFNKQINIYLNHFPNSEKYALSQSIRVDVYRVFDLIVEGQKRYHKKTTLTDTSLLPIAYKAIVINIISCNSSFIQFIAFYITMIKN